MESLRVTPRLLDEGASTKEGEQGCRGPSSPHRTPVQRTQASSEELGEEEMEGRSGEEGKGEG